MSAIQAITGSSVVGEIVSVTDKVQDAINTGGIALRSFALGIIPIAFTSVSQALGKTAGGLRLIKCVALPIHIDKLAFHLMKLSKKMDGSKRDIDYHIAQSAGYAGSIIEDAGLIVLGLNALKIVTVKTVVVAAGVFSFVGIVIQLASIWADVKRIIQAKKHIQALDKNEYTLDDKKTLNAFKDVVGLSKKQLRPLIEKIGFKERFVHHLKERINFGILSRHFNIACGIAIVVAVALQFFPPAALAGWVIVAAIGISLIAFTALKAYKEHKLNQELQALGAH